mmetsp:Transcript_17189/g.60361  ORF Transcript_17189/g.60361 Transcript_17189/m.60361 type:complete len:249 (+) Transcript_17189:136-882(+)
MRMRRSKRRRRRSTTVRRLLRASCRWRRRSPSRALRSRSASTSSTVCSARRSSAPSLPTHSSRLPRMPYTFVASSSRSVRTRMRRWCRSFSTACSALPRLSRRLRWSSAASCRHRPVAVATRWWRLRSLLSSASLSSRCKRRRPMSRSSTARTPCTACLWISRPHASTRRTAATCLACLCSSCNSLPRRISQSRTCSSASSSCCLASSRRHRMRSRHADCTRRSPRQRLQLLQRRLPSQPRRATISAS